MKRTFFGVLSVLLVLAVAAACWWTYGRMRKADERLRLLTERVDSAVQSAREAATQAQLASARAFQAAESAQTAAGARAQAEQSRQQAEQERARAVQSQAQAEAAAQQARQHAAAAEDELTRMRKQREEELNQMQEALNKIARTVRTPTGMVMTLSENTFRFHFDSAELSPNNREVLSRVAGILLASKGYGLSIFGYTDDVGTAEYNQKLSERRAKAVRDYLIEAGIDPAIVTLKGYGKTSPIAQGESEAARARNRRVEIALTDTIITYTGMPGSVPQ